MVSSFSQTTNKKVEYELLRSRPDFKVSHLNVQLFSGNLNSYNMKLNTGVSFSTFWNYFVFKAEYDLFYIYALNDYGGNDVHITSAFVEPRTNGSFNLLGSIPLYKQSLEKEVRVTVKSELSGDVRTNYYIPVQSEVGTSYNLDFGFESHQSSFGFGDEEEVKMKNTVTQTEEMFSSSSSSGEGIRTNFNYLGLKVGLSKYRVINTKIKVDGFGEKKATGISRTYAQFNYIINYEIDDVLVPVNGGSSYELIGYRRYQLQDVVNIRKWGVKLGYEIMPDRKLDFTVAVEAGLEPGPKVSSILYNGFFSFKTNIGFGVFGDFN